MISSSCSRVAAQAGRAVEDPGVRAEHVDRAVGLGRVAHQVGDRGPVPDVARDRRAADAARDLGGPVAVDVGDGDPGTLRGEALGQGPPDPVTATGHDHRCAGQLHRRDGPPVLASARCPAPDPQSRAMLANLAKWSRKARRVTPVGPFRCLATITSAVPRWSDSGL